MWQGHHDLGNLVAAALLTLIGLIACLACIGLYARSIQQLPVTSPGSSKERRA